MCASNPDALSALWGARINAPASNWHVQHQPASRAPATHPTTNPTQHTPRSAAGPTWQGTLPLSRMGRPLMRASAMVPGPALVMIVSTAAIHCSDRDPQRSTA